MICQRTAQTFANRLAARHDTLQQIVTANRFLSSECRCDDRMPGLDWTEPGADKPRSGGTIAIRIPSEPGTLLSMLTTRAGTTLLSFRLQPTLTVLLSAAGVFGFIDVAHAAARRWTGSGRRVLTAAAAVGLIGAIGFSQDIPHVLRPDLTVAYTDTDGYGQRGDRRPPGSERYYPRIDEAIMAATGKRLTVNTHRSHMPYNSPVLLDDRSIALVREWILDGANP